ncbi:uncharacterized protein EV420DRAFT_1528342 [Desarmillaria tabescens]|uniref:Uncharacterized protein n=1 Tax=Armillaria tabescens TaxID=1929756 RepID=A0AA39TX23_ARMTA|nr:uncharacterized protein EV420DRAFT_1528342 [Desarmillaria tabescens]KAK0462015.1 hypothetical protein EV420DRAFT_1528342 [Desarmillaria tabescens]
MNINWGQSGRGRSYSVIPMSMRPSLNNVPFELLESHIFPLLSPLDLVCLGKADKSKKAAVELYSATQLRRLFSRYFTEEETNKFRLLQAEYGILISGSSGVQFFECIRYPGSDLDIYVEHKHCHAVGQFLLTAGYTFNPRDKQQGVFYEVVGRVSEAVRVRDEDAFLTGYHCRGIADVYDFSRNGAQVQLITSKKSPMEIILSFHSTTPMNIISHSYAYSLFPKATFDQKRALIITTSGSGQETGRGKYRDRGWKLFEYPSVFEATDSKSEFQAGLRWVGDRKCLTLPLPPIPSLDAFIPFPYPVHINSWNMKYNRDNEAILEHEMLLAPVFSYCAADGASFLEALDKCGILKELDRFMAPVKGTVWVDKLLVALFQKYQERVSSTRNGSGAALEWLMKPDVLYPTALSL